jgi:hypothetical protein
MIPQVENRPREVVNIQDNIVSICSHLISDPDELGLDFLSWDIRFLKLGAGVLRAEIQYFHLDGFECRRIRVNRKILARGTAARPS